MAVGDAVSGPYTVTVAANDGTYFAQQSFLWSIHSTVALTLAMPANQTNSEGDTVSLSLSSTYTGSGTVIYSAVGLPAGLTISPTTGAIAGTVPVGDAASYAVTVMASDGTYAASANFTWTVGSPISITVPSGKSSIEGSPVTFSIAAMDASSGTLSFVAIGLPPGVVINPSTGAITGSIPVGALSLGSYN